MARVISEEREGLTGYLAAIGCKDSTIWRIVMLDLEREEAVLEMLQFCKENHPNLSEAELLEATERKEDKASKEATKYYNPGKEASKIRQKIQKIEKLIEDKENELSELESQYNAPENQSAYTKLSELSEAIEKVNEELEAYMEEWENLSSMLPAE